MRITALATISGLALVLFACSSEAPSGSTKGGSTPSANQNDDDDDGSSQPTKPGSTTNTGNTTNTDSTDPAPSGGSCGSSANIEACFQCCGQAHPAAVEKLEETWMTCACAADKCGTQCAQTVCAATPKDPAQGDACDTCLQAQDEACGQAAFTACESDAACKKLFECEEAAKCETKPE